MNNFRFRPLLALALLGLAGAAPALEIIYDDDPAAPRTQNTKISDAVRKADIAYADCLKASGGRMTERCAALRDKAAQLAGADAPAAPGTEAGSTAATPTTEAMPAPPPPATSE
jgi:hypothetical protein